MNNKEFFKKKFLSKNENPVIIDSKFSIIFPKYQEKKILEKWFIIRRILRFYDIETIINLNDNTIDVSTTSKTTDPYSIINARDFIKLLSRGVPIHQAAKIFNEYLFSDIIKISGFTRNKKKFLNRRKRIIGNNGSTIKVLELLTKSYILVQGNTVSCIGNFKNIKICRKIIEDCMKNIHPLVHIKNLMIKKKLLKSPKMKNLSWDNFISPKLIEKNLNKDKATFSIANEERRNQSVSIISNSEKNSNTKFNYLESRQSFIYE